MCTSNSREFHAGIGVGEKTVKVEIYARERADQSHPFLLGLPGGPGYGAAYMAPMIKQLADRLGLPALLMDFPNEACLEATSIEDWLNYLDNAIGNVLNKFPGNGGVLLFAHSAGCYYAQFYAISQRRNLQGLILCNGEYKFAVMPGLALPRPAAVGYGRLRMMAREFLSGSSVDAEKFSKYLKLVIMGLVSGDIKSQAFADRVVPLWKSLIRIPAVFYTGLNLIREFNVETLLERILCPVVVIGGREDKLTQVHHWRYAPPFKQENPSWNLIEIADVAHFPWVDRPDFLEQIIPTLRSQFGLEEPRQVRVA